MKDRTSSPNLFWRLIKALGPGWTVPGGGGSSSWSVCVCCVLYMSGCNGYTIEIRRGREGGRQKDGEYTILTTERLTLARAVRCCHISTISFLWALFSPLSFSNSDKTDSLCLASFVLSFLFSLWIWFLLSAISSTCLCIHWRVRGPPSSGRSMKLMMSDTWDSCSEQSCSFRVVSAHLEKSCEVRKEIEVLWLEGDMLRMISFTHPTLILCLSLYTTVRGKIWWV